MTTVQTSEDIRLARRCQHFLLAAVLQLACGIIFLGDIIVELRITSWHPGPEMLAFVALAVGAGITITEYWYMLRRNSKIERELGAASGAFHAAIEAHFTAWRLTEAERDVALLSIKGVPISQIAEIRNTRDGTIKAQCAAIYRKAHVCNRAELISVAIEDLIAGLGTGVSNRAAPAREPTLATATIATRSRRASLQPFAPD
jgi:DNA-binding CsgD family transcriptional regulator